MNSAIERGTKPCAFGRKPYHWTNTLKAAKVNARRAWKYAQTRCMTFLQWQTPVSIATTVSTRMRSSHSPRRHSVRFAGLPSAAGITQDNQTLLTLPHEPLKRGIRHMRRGTVPGDDQAILGYHKTQCAADNPAMVREACAAEKLSVQA